MLEMDELANKILNLLVDTDNKTALNALSQVVREFDLHVASNLIENDLEPSFMTKGSLEECFYSEGNEESGHVNLTAILKVFEQVINCDDTENDIRFEENLVRRYSQEELEEEGKNGDGITWYKRDETQTIKGILIGFETV
jgi:hypothetical protein